MRASLVALIGQRDQAGGLRENDTILSVDLGPCPAIIRTSVVRVHTLREARCIRLDDRRLLTPSQPVCGPGGRFIAAGELAAGSSVLTSGLDYEPIRSPRVIDGYFEVYTLTTDHPSHNFIAEGLVCHNKLSAEELDRKILRDLGCSIRCHYHAAWTSPR